jgi:oligopeptide/dipeptide ABC transporter ATP-binding protein
MSRRVVVMYLGKVVERTDSEALFTRPLHPYTVALMRATPVPDTKATRMVSSIPGEPPNPVEPPPGCRFHPRCPLVMDHCSASEPELREEEGRHWVACHLYPRAAGEQPVWAAMVPEGTPWARSAEKGEEEPAAVETGVRGPPPAGSHMTNKDVAE